MTETQDLELKTLLLLYQMKTDSKPKPCPLLFPEKETEVERGAVTCLWVCTHTCTHIRKCMLICTCMHIHIRTHIHTCAHTCTDIKRPQGICEIPIFQMCHGTSSPGRKVERQLHGSCCPTATCCLTHVFRRAGSHQLLLGSLGGGASPEVRHLENIH